MNAGLAILALRIGATVLLYLFLMGVAVIIWRDWRAVSRQVIAARRVEDRPLGRLVIVHGGTTELLPGQSFALGTVTGLGRALSNTVVIEDAFASNEHALLSWRGGRWWLEDLGSTNGTMLNGDRLTAPAIVATGDEIGIGAVRLRIELAAP
jgi:hypothetical protein